MPEGPKGAGLHPVAHTGTGERAVCQSMKCCACIKKRSVAASFLSELSEATPKSTALPMALTLLSSLIEGP